ncbi:FMN-binding negative transcriptional regulator [Dyadobacter tibetensis]|uniref:FMN-binding negative transcriptional regulator n=1 Tax=Dyadobacter tibetensis TaxID=1211851 RepID=UPI00046F0514|nr:FMN-binding negative transcriptional regulator [Dyadobacter tibetensis]
MHIPNSFRNQNVKEVKNFLTENSFGILINQTNGKLTGTHIPLLLDRDENGEDVLVGHISKSNPQGINFNNHEEVLAIFNGPHAYISSSWYEKENVPTWNYIAVHVYGVIQVIEGEDLLISLKTMVDKYEQGSKKPASIETMSDKTLALVHGIIGFRIKIHEIQAAYKLSQNRNDTDYHQIVDNLQQSEDPTARALASQMRRDTY